MHTNFSDGKNNPEDYVLAALDRGMESIGFSDHAPTPVKLNNWNMPAEKADLYFDEISRLKEKYSQQIEIYIGFEMDYLDRMDTGQIRKYIDRADYTIGSVHYVYDEETAKYYPIEGSKEEVKGAFEVIGKGDNRLCVQAYYQELVRVIKKYKPDFVGHLDVIKKRNYDNIFFNENDKWYRELVDRVLDEIEQTGIALEFSTGGMLYNSLTETYPSRWIINECYKKKIPIVINSDAHLACDIDAFFNETIIMLRNIGFTHHKVLRAGKWVDAEL
ncbi:MAG: histidinol-phosphatase HisJ [Gammaproteobacteria bacterium]|nr:histidinol-phosphatase HisJ [Gammaproteobacteria bacterium]